MIADKQNDRSQETVTSVHSTAHTFLWV